MTPTDFKDVEVELVLSGYGAEDTPKNKLTQKANLCLVLGHKTL